MTRNGSYDQEIVTHLAYWSVLILPMSEKVDPWYLYIKPINRVRYISHRSGLTATVPKIAPLAPKLGRPTRAKFAPSTFLWSRDQVSRHKVITGARTQIYQLKNMSGRNHQNPSPAQFEPIQSTERSCWGWCVRIQHVRRWVRWICK